MLLSANTAIPSNSSMITEDTLGLILKLSPPSTGYLNRTNAQNIQTAGNSSRLSAEHATNSTKQTLKEQENNEIY